MPLAIYLASGLSFSVALALLYVQQMEKPQVMAMMKLFAVLGGAHWGAHTGSWREIIVVCMPLLLIVGAGFCSLGVAILKGLSFQTPENKRLAGAGLHGMANSEDSN